MQFFCEKKFRNRLSSFVLFLVALVLSVLLVLPLVWMVIQSLQPNGDNIYQLPPVLPNPATLANFKTVFDEWNIPQLFVNTMTIMAGVMVLTLFSSLFVGYGFARLNGKGKNVMFGILMSTMMLPWAVTLIPSYAVWAKLGMLGTYWPLILPAIGGGAFNILLIRMFIMNIPRALDEAATIDGCSKVRILITILLPQLWPVIATIVVFTFNGVWNDYVAPMTYLWGYTDKYTFSIKLATSVRNEFQVNDWPKIMAASTLLSLPSILIVFFAQNAFTRGIVTTGLKN